MQQDNQGGPRINPDPTDRTMEALNQSVDEIHKELTVRAEIRQRESASLQELLETRLTNGEELSLERTASVRREMDINEAHRLELKSDSEKTLNTATIAAEKAVQAALAAAEKARDQQTIASQLATTKAEEASKERQDQQGETFSTGIAGLMVGLNDVKSSVAELRAERRGGQDQVIVQRDSAADMKPLLDAIAALTVAQANNQGSNQGVTAHVADQRAGTTLMVAVAGTFLLALALGVSFAALVMGR